MVRVFSYSAALRAQASVLKDMAILKAKSDGACARVEGEDQGYQQLRGASAGGAAAAGCQTSSK